jgi:8-oxo-dGTP diphosphatase
LIHVTCAIIYQSEKILCTQRSEKMKHPLKWEFPGGKVEAGESLEYCLKREIQEELNIIIQIEKALPNNHHKYGKGIEIILHPFLCSFLSGEMRPKEHKELRWLPISNLMELDWVEADLPIVANLMLLYLKKKT